MTLFKQIRVFLLYTIVATLMLSCSSKGTDYVNAIPKDVNFVTAFDLKSLGEKAGFGGSKYQQTKEALFSYFKEESSMDSSDLSKLNYIKELFDNPTKSGISFGAPAYLFSEPEVGRIIILMEVNNINNLKQIFSRLDLVDGDDLTTPVDGIYSCTTFDNSLVVFNDSRLIIAETSYYDDDYINHIKGLITQGASKSISSHKGFRKMIAQMNDIGYMIPLAPLLSNGWISYFYKELVKNSNYKFDIDKAHIIGDVNFENKRTSFKTSFWSSKASDMKRLTDNYDIGDPFIGKLMKFLPYSTLGYMGYHVDAAKLERILAKNQMLNSPLYKEISQELGFDSKALVSSFNGEILFALTSLLEDMSIPEIAIFAEVKDRYALDLVLAKLERSYMCSQSVTSTGENTYMINIPVSSNHETIVYFGITDDGLLYATNDSKVIASINEGGDNNSFLNNPLSKMLVGNDGNHLLIDVESIMNHPFFQDSVRYRNSAKRQMTSIFKENISYVEMLQSSQLINTVEFNIGSKKPERNSLNVLIWDILYPFVEMEMTHKLDKRPTLEIEDVYLEIEDNE